jgi:signal transduction histidine kinase
VVWDIRQLDAVEELTKAADAAAHRIFGDTAIGVRVVTMGRGRELPFETRRECLRVVEEALSNSRKHSGAANVQVILVYRWNRLLISVRDDGSGFDVSEAAKRPGHWGLQGIRERAVQIGAQVSVVSRPSEGTEILLSVPYRRWSFFWSRQGRH